VVAALLAGEFGLGGDQFAAEGSGEDRLGQLVAPGRRRGDAAFDRVGKVEEGVDATNDLSLLSDRGDRDRDLPRVLDVDPGMDIPK